MYLKRQQSAEREKGRRNAQRRETLTHESETGRQTDMHLQTGCLVFVVFIPWSLPFLRPGYSPFSLVPWDAHHSPTNKFPI